MGNALDCHVISAKRTVSGIWSRISSDLDTLFHSMMSLFSKILHHDTAIQYTLTPPQYSRTETHEQRMLNVTEQVRGFPKLYVTAGCEPSHCRCTFGYATSLRNPEAVDTIAHWAIVEGRDDIAEKIFRFSIQ